VSSPTAGCLLFAATGDRRLLPWKQNQGLFFQKRLNLICVEPGCMCVCMCVFLCFQSRWLGGDEKREFA
jgi:hypothetical protein